MNKKSLFVWLNALLFLSIFGGLLIDQTVTAKHSIRVQYGYEYKWAAWEMAYSVNQIAACYPELLPWVHPLNSRIKEVREAAQGKYENAYYDMHWLDEDGLHIFSTLYKARGIQNYWQKYMDNFILPSPYLKSDESHTLKHDFGQGIKGGTYFIAPTDNDFESYGPGFFIEILPDGWKLGNIDLQDYDIYAHNNNNEIISQYKNLQFVTPLLPFGKYVLKHKEGGWDIYMEVI